MLDVLGILDSQKSKSLTDNQYLKEYLYSFYRIYECQIASIKDNASKYIASTDGYAQLFGFESARDIINQTDLDFPCPLSKHTQHDRIIEFSKVRMDFLEVHEYSGGFGAYVFHKQPIINPSTDNVVGILYYVERYKYSSTIKILMDMHNTKFSKYKANLIQQNYEPPITLGEIQLEVLFCILCGFKEDKAIANFINKIKNTKYTFKNISNAVSELYKKFNTNSRDDLIQAALSKNFHHRIPLPLIKSGSYFIHSFN